MRTPLIAALLALAVVVADAQTKITPPKNKFSPEEDVKIGLEAAAEARKEYPVIENDGITSYLTGIGDRLVDAAPPELNNPVFKYSFTPVNLKEINAFALPGGPMFVNRGMFEAAATEGEVAGVMAHELSHVLLRHGTANATKAQGFQIGAIAGAIAGAVVGGGVGQVIAQGSQFGLGTWLLKYSRDYEKQADLLGTQIMARAGYDPRDLAHMFETIERESKGGGAPEWMSSHPNPGNRTQYIEKEAQALTVAKKSIDPRGLDNVKTQLAKLPAPRSMSDPRRASNDPNVPRSNGTIGETVPPPSGQFRIARGGRLFEVAVPSNWQAITSNSSVKYVPQNAYGDAEGQTVVTHGVELGVTRAPSRDLGYAHDAFINALLKGNPELSVAGERQSVQLSRRQGIGVPLVGRSPAGGRERVGVYTTFLADGNLFYYLTIVPEAEASRYAPAFDRIGQSIRLLDTGR